MRIMGLDVGTKTIGVAISDEMGWTAQGIETVSVQPEKNITGLKRLKELVNEYKIEKIVVGLPKNMNGTIGPRGEACQEYGEYLKKKLDLPIVFWDERLTTMQAERVLISADMKRKQRKKVIDKMAAVMILQSYLDSNS